MPMRFCLCASALFLLLSTSSAQAQEDQTSEPKADSLKPRQTQLAAQDDALSAGGWQFTVAPYVWFLSVEGDVTLRGITSDVDASFSDIWDNLNIGGFLFAEAKKGPISIFTDTIYADLEADRSLGPLSVNADVDLLVFNFGLRYKVAEVRLSERGAEHPIDLAIEPSIGGRLFHVEADITPSRLPTISESETWVDPILGLRLSTDITPRLNAFALGDIGGFGVSSDITWQLMAAIGYRFGIFGENDANLAIGYRAIHDDYETGSGTNRFAIDATFKGPILGLQLLF